MYVQIISVLFVLLILYYAVMIFLDIQKEKAAKAAEQERNHEEEIDISDEASTFKPVMITRDDPKKAQTDSTSSDSVSGSTTENQDSPESQNDEVKKENSNPDSFKREGYREAHMTDGIPVEQIIQQVDEYAETGKGPLGEIIFECRSAQF